MKKRLLALFMVLVLCMTMVLTGCKDKDKTDDSTTPKDTEVTLNGSIEKTFNAMLSADAGSAAIMENALNKGKITIALGEQLENVLYLDSSSKAFANNLSFNEGGQSVNIGIYGKDKEFAIAAPELLGDTVYGINLETLATDLKDSAIWSLMGTDYDTFMSEYSEQIEQITSLLEGMDEEAVNEMADKLVEDISEALKDVEVTTKEDEVEIYGEKVKATVITYHMEKADIEKLMDVMIGWTEEMMTGIMDEMGDIIGESATIEGGSIEDVFEQLRSEIDAGLDGVEIEGDFYAYINSKTQYLMQMGIELTATVEGETGVIDVAFVLGKDPTKSDKFAFVMDVESDDEKRTMEVSLSIDEKTEGDVKTTTFTLAADMDGEKQEIVLAFAHDQKKNEYKVSLNAEDTEVSLSGKLEITDSKFHFTIDEVEADGETMPLGLAITVEVGAEGMPAMPAYTNILKLSEDELMELLGQMEMPEMPDIDIPDSPIVDYPDDNEDHTDLPAPIIPSTGNLENDAVVLYKDKDFTLTATGIEKDQYGWNLYVTLENRTNHTVAIGCDATSVNGIAVEPYGMIEGLPGKIVNGYFRFDSSDYAPAVINDIGYIYADHMWIYEKDEYSTLCEFGFKLDVKKGVQQAVDTSGDVIFDSNKVKIIAKGDLNEDYGEYETTIVIVNGRNEAISVDMDNFSVNGTEVDDFGFPTVPANCVMYYTLGIWSDDCPVEIKAIKTISFEVQLSDADFDDVGSTEEVSIRF